MKFEIKQNILMEHLNYAIKGISNKNIIPILNCFRIGIILISLYLSDKSSLAYLFSKLPVYYIIYLHPIIIFLFSSDVKYNRN